MTMHETEHRKSNSFWSALLREPLLHFVVLGGLIFAIDHALVSGKPDPREIVVGPEVDAEARAIFRTAQGREPSDAEMRVLRERWIDNEVLYREGLALRLEQGDPALRERVIFKALNVIEQSLPAPEVDDLALRAWFEQQRARYDIPARFDFAEAVVSGDWSEDGARRFAAALNSGAPADVQSGLRVFDGRPQENIETSFGAEFASALARMPLDQWQVLPSKDGPRVVRLQAHTPGERANFEALRTRVRQDWLDEQAQQLRTSAVRQLGKKYTVRFAGAKS